MQYNELIKEIRKSKKLSLRKFAEIVGLSWSYIAQLEKNRSVHDKEIRPPIDTLKQICDRTGYPFRKFLEETGYIEPYQEPSPAEVAEFKELIENMVSGEELKNISTLNDALNKKDE